MLLADMIKFKSSLLKMAVSLAGSNAKCRFLQVCSDVGVLPNGFSLKFSQQTGLPEELAEDSERLVKETLKDASYKLLNVTLQAEKLKSDLLQNNILEKFTAMEEDERPLFLDLAVTKYRKILFLRSRIHGKKLRKLGKSLPNYLDLDQDVTDFETKILDNFCSNAGVQSQPQFDWFDQEEFPPLEASVRRDWTLDIEAARPPQSEISPPRITSTPKSFSSVSNVNEGYPSTSSVVRDEGYPSTSSEGYPRTSKVNIVDLEEGYPRTSSEGCPSTSSAIVNTEAQGKGKVSQSPITIVDYSSTNFKPLILHGIEASEGIVSLLKKGPTFTPTPLNPPDLSVVQDDILDWKERIRWAFVFRSKKLLEDPRASLDNDPFVKPPWYSRTEKLAPKASEEVETFMSSVETYLLSSTNFSKCSSNVSAMESKAFTELRKLKADGVSVFLQDKSSRFVLAKSEVIAEKVDKDMNDLARYEKIGDDDSIQILDKIKAWYKKRKKNLSEVTEDISDWLINVKAKPGKLKVLIKTHKPNLPVREVFSVCSQPVENLSALLQFSYLGPIVNSGVLKWRLKDTTDFVRFLHSVNDYLLENRVTDKPSICSIDIKNMFPSVFKSLALPAIKARLQQRGYGRAEVNAVLEALEIVRDGTRVQWRDETIKQIDGCSLGPADSCDYSDIALDAFLMTVVPLIEESLNLNLQFLRFFRDDGFLIFFGGGEIILDMLEILNSQREELTFTTEKCSCSNVLGCCQMCEKRIPFLDCSVSIYTIETEDGMCIPQLKTETYAKPTDVHHYIDPTSCTPNLNRKSLSIIKGVAHRLRVTNMLDEDLLMALNVYSGYLVASGYDKITILRQFTDILNTTNRAMAFRTKPEDLSFKIAFVTDMHPSLPNIQRIFDRFYPVIKSCTFSSRIFPRQSLISSSRKLRNLSSILASNPFGVPQTPSKLKGFQKSDGCKCKICEESFFTSLVYHQVFKDRGFQIPAPINCKALNVIYLVICECGKYYVGRTEKPRLRWANHKSHVRNKFLTCNLAKHCAQMHRNFIGTDRLTTTEEVRAGFKFILLESLGEEASIEDLKRKEDVWRTRLDSWAPSGLNTRDD